MELRNQAAHKGGLVARLQVKPVDCLDQPPRGLLPLTNPRKPERVGPDVTCAKPASLSRGGKLQALVCTMAGPTSNDVMWPRKWLLGFTKSAMSTRPPGFSS